MSYSKSLKAPETDSLNLPVDENGYITIFDGETFNGWRGYGKDRVPTKWIKYFFHDNNDLIFYL